MGMAASQARLLSITSRMSDNELRSQLINNAKMRLTSESSKASEKYLAALNETQLMFSNYNLEGESQYQQLTFNSLTAYSAYNNQYGISNKGGEILVSEADAAKYKAAFEAAFADNTIEPDDIDGRNSKALEEFLKSYGLIKDTTYFERSELYSDFGPNIKDIYEGNMIFQYTDDKAERLSGIHYGYEESLKSKDYGIYLALLDNYEQADSIYDGLMRESMQNYVSNLTSTDINGKSQKYSQTYKDVIEWYSNEDNWETNEETGERTLKNTASTLIKNYADLFKKYYDQIKTNGYFAEKGKLATLDNVEDLSIDSAFHKRIDRFFAMIANEGNPYPVENGPGYKREGIENPTFDENGNIIISEEDLEEHPIIEPPQYYQRQKTDASGQPLVDENGDPIMEDIVCQEYLMVTISTEEAAEALVDMYRFFQGNIIEELDRSKLKDDFIANNATNADNADLIQKLQTADANYKKAAKELSLFIFGQVVPESDFKNLDDIEWILYGDNGIPPYPTTAIDSSEGGIEYDMDFEIANHLTGDELPYRANFQVVIDIYLSELMMAEYGTPNYTWIDINNPNENADKKAEWYTNLFNRMTQGGYQALENGLASSPEWLKFAFESGLLTMEQVNIQQDWVSTMYSNCSNITESQVDVDITIAEAEYNKTMKEIEAKDKRYDIELKNIDTEHSALQTEYETIKSVINKNVERNFKMFEA